MKSTIYSLDGKKKGEVEMPKMFSRRIREDIIKKYFEMDKLAQPYSSDPKGGKKASASGTISHKRHDWKGHYGRGIARLPRKTMWRRGTQFFWIGAEVSGTRGGRRAHPPKGIGKEKKINKKEIVIAMEGAFASTGKEKFVVGRYSKLNELKIKVPVVIESKFDKNPKAKEMFEMLKEVFGDIFTAGLIKKNKKVRAGRGKLRGRKYKSNAGVLFVKAMEEKVKINGIGVKNVDEVSVGDLYPLGRLVVYTEKALEVLESVGGKK